MVQYATERELAISKAALKDMPIEEALRLTHQCFSEKRAVIDEAYVQHQKFIALAKA